MGMYEGKPATDLTKWANKAWLKSLDFDDKTEKECAKKGLIEAPESVVIRDADGNAVWNVDDYRFLDSIEKPDDIPDSINPSLYRNTLYNSYAGLFEVCDGIYQVRGYDMANATFIRTDHGWIVFDVLMCSEDMQQAKALMEKHFGKINVVAVMYSHSHIDHYGGIFGLIDRDDAADASKPLSDQLASGKVVIFAPDGFLEHAVSENIYAGVAMGRRAMFQYGTLLKTGERGRLSIGIGLGQSLGHAGLLPPTYVVKTDETLIVDGVEVRFQLTPGTEAPAEMNAFFPGYNALWLAENCTGTMHNLYTLRGAEVRNASDWARYILEAEQKFGDETDVVFQSHNWPHWGREEVREYMENTAAVYQYINDQTLHYINLGYTPAEISNTLKLPGKLNKVWYMRQYYGTLSHNVKAVYQRYMGWYDANPVNLAPMSPADEAKKWVEYLGDTDEVIAKAREDFDKGEYQWVAQVMKQLVFADPSNRAARELCADALEQLGYQAESGTWRNAYLTGALELRLGNQVGSMMAAKSGMDSKRSMTTEMFLTYVDISTDAIAAQDDDLTFELNITDTGEKFFVKRKAGVLLIYKEETKPAAEAFKSSETAEAVITCPKMALMGILAGSEEAKKAIKIEGDPTVLPRVFKYMTTFRLDFNIVEP